MAEKNIYKVSFVNQGKIYEVYAGEVCQSGMLGFIEIGDFQFGEKSDVIVDPSEEKIKSEFAGVKRSYIPMHAVIRIDEVQKHGTAKIKQIEGETGKITPFPIYNPGGDNKPS